MDTNFVYLSELILNIYIIFHSGPPFGKYRGFSVVHGNNLRVTIFFGMRLGMKNDIYTLDQLVQIYKMVVILDIYDYLKKKTKFFWVNTFRGKTLSVKFVSNFCFFKSFCFVFLFSILMGLYTQKKQLKTNLICVVWGVILGFTRTPWKNERKL